jgi:VanZ family protein
MPLPRFVHFWTPVIAWLLLIYAGSTDLLSATHTSRFLVPFFLWLDPNISPATLEMVQLIVRKLGHLTEYAILAGLLWRALHSGTNLRMRLSILFIAVLLPSAIFAVTDEFHQSFVASRTASPIDVMIDIGGALIGLMICWMFTRKKSRHALRG